MELSEQEIDRRTLSGVKTGDRQAFARLYDRHAAWMMAVAYRILQNRRDAEDLLHDVFLEIWKRAETYNPERGTVRTWLAVRLRSRAIDRIRALSRRRGKPANENDERRSGDTEQSALEPEINVDYACARRAVNLLPSKQRTVIHLSYFQGLTCQEISDRCQIPLGTVKTRLASGILSLRQQLHSAEDDSPCN